MKDTTKIIKKRVAQFLNGATTVVVQSYERYLKTDLPETLEDESKRPEEFKKFHDAGKSAASHLETLMKLANAADDPEGREDKRNQDAQEQNRLEKIKAIEAAKAELKGRENGESDG